MPRFAARSRTRFLQLIIPSLYIWLRHKAYIRRSLYQQHDPHSYRTNDRLSILASAYQIWVRPKAVLREKLPMTMACFLKEWTWFTLVYDSKIPFTVWDGTWLKWMLWQTRTHLTSASPSQQDFHCIESYLHSHGTLDLLHSRLTRAIYKLSRLLGKQAIKQPIVRHL